MPALGLPLLALATSPAHSIRHKANGYLPIIDELGEPRYGRALPTRPPSLKPSFFPFRHTMTY